MTAPSEPSEKRDEPPPASKPSHLMKIALLIARATSQTPVNTMPPPEVTWIGTDAASQILSLVLVQACDANPFTGFPIGLPFPKECFTYPRTHGAYQGDGRAERKLKLGFRPAGVAFADPSPYRVLMEKLAQPAIVDDGFVVALPHNELGQYYEYVVFYRPEDARLAPLSPPPATFRHPDSDLDDVV